VVVILQIVPQVMQQAETLRVQMLHQMAEILAVQQVITQRVLVILQIVPQVMQQVEILRVQMLLQMAEIQAVQQEIPTTPLHQLILLNLATPRKKRKVY
jgi:hypothetical protein